MPRDDDAQRAIISEYLEQFTQEIQSKIKVQCMALQVPRRAIVDVHMLEENKQSSVPKLDLAQTFRQSPSQAALMGSPSLVHRSQTKEMRDSEDPRAGTVVGPGGREPSTLLHDQIKSEAEESSELEVIQEANLRYTNLVVKSSHNLTAVQLQHDSRTATQTKYAVKVVGNNQLFLYELMI